MNQLDNNALDQLFRNARTQYAWLPEPVSDDTLRALYDLLKMAPTSANSQPMRVIFVRTPEGKEKLAACVNPGNVEKVKSAPVTAIIGYDESFYEHLPRMHPSAPGFRDKFVGNPAFAHATAFRNSSMQAGYFILAARALGLGTGPMSGFDAAKLDNAFWEGKGVKTNLICSLGHGDPAHGFPRAPRFAFEEACTLA